MDLVLTDIYRWKTQLATEMSNIDDALKNLEEQKVHLEATRKVAKQKISEADTLLKAHNFEAPAELNIETAVEAVAAEEPQEATG